MFKENVDVEVKLEDGQTDIVEVEIDIDDLDECEDDEEKIAYIRRETEKQHLEIKKVKFKKKDLKEVKELIRVMRDTSDRHPNETYEEFMEHEAF